MNFHYMKAYRKTFSMVVGIGLLVCLCTIGRTQHIQETSSGQKEKISIGLANDLYEKSYKEHDPWKKTPDAAVLAWGEFYTLQALVDLYEASANKYYLEEVAFRGDRLLTYRDDRRRVADGSGKKRPGWTMNGDFVTAEATLSDAGGRPVVDFRSTTFDYNNSTTIEVQPLSSSRFTLVVANERKKRTEVFRDLSLDPADERYIEKIVNDPMAPPQAKAGEYTEKSNLLRITKVYKRRHPVAQSLTMTPIPLAFMGYVGIIYDPMMRFAEIVKKDPFLGDLLPAADRFIQAAEETYRDASKRLWRNGPGKEEGYYLCSERGESFPWDNVGLPYNFLAKHVSTELALYRLTGKSGYLERSTRMINHFKNRLQHDEKNDAYVWDYWYEPVTTTGWKPSDNISENMRFLKPFSGPEDISHASITISLVEAGYRMGIGFDKADMRRFANTLLKNILNEDRTEARSDVAGKGNGREYFAEIYGYLCLIDGNEEVYHAIKEAYIKWDGQRLPFLAGLLKWEKKMLPSE